MKQDIFWFYISVNNVTVMHELDGKADLSYHSSDSFFAESTFFFHGSVYISSTARFQNEI